MNERRPVTLSQQRHGVSVTGECADVLFDPVQRGHYVEQRVVAGSIAVAGAQETYASTYVNILKLVELVLVGYVVKLTYLRVTPMTIVHY